MKRLFTVLSIFLYLLMVITGAAAAVLLGVGEVARVHAGGPPVIEIHTVEELCRTTHDPAKYGAILKLPGTFVLTGPVVLGPGQSLSGGNEYIDVDGDGVWDAREGNGLVFAAPETETVIDARAIVSLSEENGIIELGSSNRVERLTVVGDRAASKRQSLVVIRQGPGGPNAEGSVRDCVLRGGRHGIRAINATGIDGARLAVEIERNVLFGNLNNGIQLANINQAGAELRAFVTGNRSFENRFGLSIQARGGREGRIHVTSAGNIYERNTVLGLEIVAKAAVPALPANDNELFVDSHDDTIWQNGLAGNVTSTGGVLMAAGCQDPTGVPFANRNRLYAKLLGTRFTKGDGRENVYYDFDNVLRRGDIIVAGALSLAGQLPGVDNVTEYLVRRATGAPGVEGAYIVLDSEPLDPSGSNRAVSKGSDVAFKAANEIGFKLSPFGGAEADR